MLGALPGVIVGNRLAAEKLVSLESSGVPLALFAERFQDAVKGWLPAFLIGSVVLFSLALYALCFRQERRYIPHAIFALHWTAFYVIVIAVARLFPEPWGVQILAVFIAIAYLTIALRRVYRQSVLLSFGKALTLLLIFFLILVLWVQSALSLGMMLA